MKDYLLPKDLFYHKKHFWIKIEQTTATVGITDFSQKLAGKFDYIELPEVGDLVKQDEVIGSIETGKWIGKLISPLSGKISCINGELEDNPRLINRDPYNMGWLYKIENFNESELDNLLYGDAAIAWQEEEVIKHS